MKVLLAENSPLMRRAFAGALQKRKAWVEIAVGFDLNEYGRLQYQTLLSYRYPLSAFSVALIDSGNELGLESVTVVRKLTALGVACIGIAALAERNEELLAAGAKLALCKPVALAAIYTGVLPLNASIENPSLELKARLEHVHVEHRQNEKLKQKMRDLIASAGTFL